MPTGCGAGSTSSARATALPARSACRGGDRFVGDEIGPAEIGGAIVLIEYADPGFDWIFGQDIAGLVTKYGGANSHMAIRCAEFGLPAAIGCGGRLFERLSGASVIELNCAANIVKAAIE